MDAVLESASSELLQKRTERLKSETANHFPHGLQLKLEVSAARTSKC